MNKRVGIIGADSKIGNNLFFFLKSNGFIVYLFGRRLVENNNYVFLDLERLFDIEKYIKNLDVVIYCAGITSFVKCKDNPNLSYKINVLSALNIASICKMYNCKFIYFSTNAVLPCNKNKKILNMIGGPIGIYGLHKKIAEDLLLLYNNIIVFRISKIMSPSDEIFLHWIKSAKIKKKIDVYFDHHVAPISICDVNKCIKYLILNNSYGLFQLSGNENISYYDLCIRFFKKNNISDLDINPIYSRPEFDRIQESTMDSQRILNLLQVEQPTVYSVLDI